MVFRGKSSRTPLPWGRVRGGLYNKKLYGLSELEVVVNGLVIVGSGLTVDLDAKLVERIVIASSHTKGEPRVAAGHHALHALRLPSLLERLLLLVILQLQQHPLPLQF
jgi:hypothetical protein